MDDSVTGAGFHAGSTIRILDHDPSPHPRHNHHHHHPLPPIPCAVDTPSDDDEDDDDESGDAANLKKASSSSPSLWHRMKWSDDMVRLLIAIVSYVGDDGTPDAADAVARRRPGAALQKKGKWKAVSQLLLEKGCYISPQQCEDKFNDLNKRYKRLNEILGRGTTCQVVENPSLLDSMPQISPKAKEDVRKILGSKHLFYREMCAYHNGPRMTGSHDIESHGHAAAPTGDSEDSEEEEDNGVEEEGGDEFGKQACDSLLAEIDAVLRDKSKTFPEQLDWFHARTVQIQEERVEIEAEALELEKRRFKWQRFRSKKDREMERLRLGNERLKLENERMAMQLRKREIELEHNRHGDSTVPTGCRVGSGQGRDIMDLS